MRLSIIINNFNYGRFISTAIDSALAVDWPDKEVIVVDDGSTNDSRDIIARYADGIIPVLKENGGQCDAVNTGFVRATGEAVIILDSDDRLFPDVGRRLFGA
jgi:glycosyltransferase involved in cell wall biosynthesis